MRALWAVSLLVSLIALLSTIYIPASREPLKTHLANFGAVPPGDIQIRDAQGAAERLAGCLRYKTVSVTSAENHAQDKKEFKGLHKFLRRSFPLVFQKLEVKEVSLHLHKSPLILYRLY